MRNSEFYLKLAFPLNKGVRCHEVTDEGCATYYRIFDKVEFNLSLITANAELPP